MLNTSSLDLSHAILSAHEAVFVGTFLRFEFALKEAGYAHRDGNAQVDWGCVTKVLGAEFYKAIVEAGGAKTILARPPQKQVTRGRSLDWDEQPPPKTTHELFVAVRCIRNNVVHGGKAGHPDTDNDDPERNQRLVTEAQWIVERALWRMNDVRCRFEGRY